ncbi:hypothetical protein L1987_12964 [Smallanthus sonchifolius]|uniref:Uncharacterized protein n=1 Tax=Smallanthus sonchifolius TaxID=185202 RepID=A0ACB9JHX6_9ASTR|nr:hypothetical protein L1987_12964 [Smallanthus sonchifolius]
MLPMWVVFSLLSIISATRSTFFLQQYNNLDTDDDIALQIYSLVQAFSKFVIPFLYAWFCCLRKNEKVKIGVGILCGVARLTSEGLLKIYKSIIKEEQLHGYREEYIEFVMGGMGKLLHILIILILQRSFKDTINDSKLDRYYLVLVFVLSATFILYCFIAILFYKDQELADDDSQQNHLREQISDIVQNQDLDNDDQKQHNEDFTNVDCMEQISDTEQNQDLANKDQNEDNEDSTNVGVQQDHCIEQSSDIENTQDLANEGHKQDEEMNSSSTLKVSSQTSVRSVSTINHLTVGLLEIVLSSFLKAYWPIFDLVKFERLNYGIDPIAW